MFYMSLHLKNYIQRHLRLYLYSNVLYGIDLIFTRKLCLFSLICKNCSDYVNKFMLISSDYAL